VLAKSLQRVLAAVARTAAIELANYKRVLKESGFSEAEIHAVIPDRSSSTPKKRGPEPEPK